MKILLFIYFTIFVTFFLLLLTIYLRYAIMFENHYKSNFLVIFFQFNFIKSMTRYIHTLLKKYHAGRLININWTRINSSNILKFYSFGNFYS